MLKIAISSDSVLCIEDPYKFSHSLCLNLNLIVSVCVCVHTCNVFNLCLCVSTDAPLSPGHLEVGKTGDIIHILLQLPIYVFL